ncbi:MAG: HAMP domain-containing sensor histidine kinase [Thermomicrobiales bacterium]
MFAKIGRRLALLNAVVVVAVIAAAGLVTYLLLLQNLNREADRVLSERVESARESWGDLIDSGSSASGSTGEDHLQGSDREQGDDDDHEARDLLESGDVLLFAVTEDGRLVANARGLSVPGLPDKASINAALGGATDARTVRIADESMRVLSEPVLRGDRTVGVVQAAQSDREHRAELRLVGMTTLAGVALGAIVAIPAGLFLARRAMRPIDAAFARQREFVADASHELRTPLTLIRATAELVQRLPDASPAVKDELKELLSEVDSTNRLVDDLLLLARIDSSEMQLRKALIDLGATVRAAVAPFALIAQAAKLGLELEIASDVIVEADPDRVRQIVRILLDNAIAYTSGPGRVSVEVTRRGNRGVVTVRDTGVGIAANEQRQVFDRFYRAERSRSRSSGGTGLGLAIARALTDAHGGEIGLESSPGHGTSVWFALPLARMA